MKLNTREKENKPKNKKKLNLDLGSKKEKENKGEKQLVYKTTLIDKIAKKISFESLDISSNFSIHEDTAFAKNGYIRVFNILGYPPEVAYSEDRGYLSSILNSLKNIETFSENVDFYYESYNKPYRINFDKNTKRRYEGLERMETSLRAQLEDKDKERHNARDKELKQVTNDSIQFRLNEVIKKKNTYNIIKNNQNRGKFQFESYQFIRMVCKKKSLLDVAEKELTTRLKSVDITLRKVRDLSEYFETFSPVAGLYAMDRNNDFASNIFTTQGYSKIRNKPTRIMENELEGLSRLVCVGTDIETFEPLGLSFTSSGSGQNIAIVGTSGSGKTYLYENLMMNAALNGFKINAMDYKGNEYGMIADIIPNTITLDFSLNSPTFVNSLKFIPELYDKSEWKKAFAKNTEATVKGLRILAGVSPQNAKTADNALENMIKTIYSKHKVFFDEIESYYNTKYIDFFKDIGEGVNTFNSQRSLKETYGEDVCRELYSGLMSYFSTLSHRSNMFANEINLKEVLDKNCIIHSFDMNDSTPWDTLVAYKIYNMDYISNLFIQKNKREGYSTINSLEEYQRAVNFSELRTIYNSKLSGGRSDNVINVVLTNTIRPFLDKSFDISAIRENISTVFIGKLEDMDALKDFCRIFNMQDAEDKILKLQNYNYTFYANYDTGRQKGARTIKAIHPKYISKFLETKKID